MSAGYGIIERIDFIREYKIFNLNDYINKFNISRRTAFRDFAFINVYKNYRIRCLGDNIYKLIEVRYDSTRTRRQAAEHSA